MIVCLAFHVFCIFFLVMRMGTYRFGRFFLLILFLLIEISGFSQVKVIDANDSQPVISASVFDANDGTFLGMTDYDGFLPKAADVHDNIHIQHINYNPVNITPALYKNSDVLLTPRIHQLPEVKVNKPEDAEIRMKVYIRQYRVLKGKPASFSESIAYLYFKTGNEDKPTSSKILSESSYENHNAMTGESHMLKSLASCSDLTSFLLFNGHLRYNSLRGSRRLRSSWKRAGSILYMNEDSINKKCEIVHDSLFSEKPFKIPLFGFAFANVYISETYSTEYGAPKIYSLLNVSDRYRVYQTKTMGYVDEYAEVYVLGIDYATKEERKADKKLKKTEFVRPQGIIPSNDFMFEALKTMTKIEK